MQVKVVRQILEWNKNCHEEVKNYLSQKGVTLINIMGSPGTGKTTFIIALVKELRKRGKNVAVIEGDVEGTIDAKRVQEEDIPVVQLNTQGACHIEAMAIKNVINYFDLEDLDMIIVENIGNLVCPAEFDIGDTLKIALLSIPEGDDKVIKYPLMFVKADAVVLTKYDMKDYFEFNDDVLAKELTIRNKRSKLFKVNSRKDGELIDFTEWIINKLNK